MRRNKTYVKDKMVLSTFGLLDKTIMQSRTAESLIRFINHLIRVKRVTEKETLKVREVTEYWKDCADISERKKAANWKHIEKKEREINRHKKS